MKRNLYSFLILTIFGVLSLISRPADAQYIEYQNDSGWKLGFNIGSTWQQSDMKAVAGFGFGATFGKALYQKEGKFFAFDLRYRYLRGWTWGYDLNRDTNLVSDPIFNGNNNASPELNYYADSLGYLHRNYLMDFNEHTLEGVLTLNRLREKTGIVLYGFGGIGMVGYKVRTNQYDEFFGTPYNYNTLDSGNVERFDLSAMYDDTYETNAIDVNPDAKRKIGFMPSLGVGLGYQFGPHFAMGIEHKVTFPMNDIIDGKSSSQINHKLGVQTNDRIHYTALKLWWHLGKGGGSTTHHHHYTDTTVTNVNNYSNNQNTVTNNTNPVVVNKQLPIVNITNPSMSPATSHAAVFTVNANIYYVSSSSNVSFKVNGSPIYGFTFNPSTSQFSSTITLQPGNNVIEIRGENKDGYDYQSVVINYDMPVFTPPAPIITYTNPPFSPYNTNNHTFNVTATILNIQGAQNITYKVNGVLSNNFTFNPSTQAFSSLIALNPGTNVVEIKAVNSAGQDVESATLNYQVQTNSGMLPPVVTINNPTLNPYTVNVNSTTIDATVLNVASQNDITLKINGSVSYNFTYNLATKHMNIVATLAEGANIFEIKATNAAGSDSKTTTIIYVKPTALPPLITYTDPSVNPVTVSNAIKVVKANVLHVTSQSDIHVKFNGNTVTNFTYNLSTKELTYNASLVLGANIMEITATNSVGTDIKSTTIIYQKQNSNPPPVVTITYPSANPSTTTVNSATIVGSVLNVAGASNITYTVNGVASTAFNYDATTKVFTSNATLVPGNNVFTITGTNAYGSDTESTTIIYNEPCNQPVIIMVQPGTNNFTTANSTENITANILNVAAQSNIQFKVNNVAVPFTFNPASGTLNAAVNLNNGSNTISVTATNNCGSVNSTSSITYNRPLVPPVVTITVPSVNPYSTTVGTCSVMATILNVNSISGVSMKVNGSSTSNFTFNVATHQLGSNVTLVPGNNTVEITGTNTDGTDSKSTVIVYNPQPAPCNNPVVIINNPSSTVYATAVSSVAIGGTVTGIESASELSMKVNGSNSTIQYNATNNTFNAMVSLQEGANSIQVIATNGCGTTTSTVTVNYTRPLTPPVVTIINPGQNPFTVQQPAFTLTANIINIQAASQISFTQNGSANSSFNFDPVSHSFTCNVTLAQGNNTFTITATNTDGTDSESTVIVYENIVPPCLSPVATVTSPATSTVTVNQANYSISINVLNVSNQNQLVLKKNGTPVNVMYSIKNKVATANVTLAEGSNTFEFIANNDCGSATATFTVVYNRLLVPPVVTIVNPSVNPFTTNSANFNLSATVAHVDAASGILFKFNGTASTAFTFNPVSDAFAASLNLQNGNNTVEITGTNNDGTDFASTVIIYNPVVAPCDKPVVKFITPPNNQVITNGNLALVATVSNVKGSGNIVFKLNGNPMPFNFNAGELTSNMTLTQTVNVFEITATNACGSVTEVVHTTYNKPLPPPSVTITNPNPSPKTVTQPQFVFTANVQGVSAASQVVFKYNNQVNNTFTFDPSSGNMSANVVLNSGNNTFEVTATNAAGSDNASAAVVYQIALVECNKPAITLTQPSGNTVVSQNTFTIKGTIKDVVNQSAVSLKQNGNTISFTLGNGRPAQFSSNVTLAEGANNFVLSATNECGTTTVNFTITYNRPVQPPVVTITYPTNNPFTSVNPSVNIGATVQYVNGASDITYKVNGNAMTNFAYNPNSDVFSGPATLVMGNNTIEIIATNIDGSDNASTVVIYQPCTGTPAISLTSPSPVNATVTSDQLTVTAQISNAFAQNEITFKLNGATKTFSYNPNSGSFSGNLTLQQGSNTIEIYVNNNCGKTDNVFTMTYTPNNGGGNNQITICHYPPGNTGNPQTLTIPQNAWPAHLAHGDTLGACPVNKTKLVDPEVERKLKEEEMKKKAAEEEAKRKAAEEAARKKAEEDAKRKAAEEEAKRKAAEQEAIKKAQEEQQRKAAEEAARKKAAEEEAKRKAAEEAVKKKAAEEAAKKKAEEDARKKAEEENKKKAGSGGTGNPVNKGNNITVGEEGVD
ncbi:MAG: beta strand repeat-containing protein [Bacteroidota bacterium]